MWIHALHFIPPVGLDEVFDSDPLPIMMTLQTPDVRRRVLSQRENEFRVWKFLIEFLVKQKPRPVFERLVFLSFLHDLVDQLSFDLQREIHIESLMLVAETP